MSDIISARCFGCGNVIKVPSGLGGKKARCPQCTNTITIPMPSDTQMDEIIPDTELPEVARDGDRVIHEDGDAAFPGSEPEKPVEDPSEARRRAGTGVRRSGGNSGATNPRITAQRSGTQPRYNPGSGPASNAQKSNPGMMIGIALGVLALIILAVVLSNGGGHGKAGAKGGGTKEKEKERDNTPKNPQPQYSPEDQALVTRLLDYTAAVNRGDAAGVLKFYTYEPDDERKYRIRATEMVDKKTAYENVKVTSVSAAGGTISFSSGAGSKSLTWKQVGDVWMINELPSP